MAKRRGGKRSGRRSDERRDRVHTDAIQRIERAMLELAGEHGYASVTIAAVLARSGSNRSQFYAVFAGKRNCFESAYGAVVDSLVEELLDPCAAEASWAAGVREALDLLVGFLRDEPELARGVLTEAGPIGDGVVAKRQEIFGRLTLAVDRGRREIPGSRHAPPPFTARFILGAIESVVIKALREPGTFPDAAEELAELVLAYFPPDAQSPQAT